MKQLKSIDQPESFDFILNFMTDLLIKGIVKPSQAHEDHKEESSSSSGPAPGD